MSNKPSLQHSTQNQNQAMTSRQRSDALPPPPKDILMQALNIEKLTVEWLAGDGSDRCYYRLISPQLSDSLVLMQLSEIDANKLRDDGYDWLKIARILKTRELRVPAPIVTLPDHAALVIEDYGDIMLEAILHKAAAGNDRQIITRLYDQCVKIIEKMLVIPRNDHEVWCQRAFDVEKYSWELRFFRREFLQAVLNLDLSPTESAQFDLEVDQLASYLAQFSNYFTHRDFHSRNIMVKGEQLALIDFQDARLGAASYDLVSLVFDNYVPLDMSHRRELLKRGLGSIAARLGNLAEEQLYKPCGGIILQRQLKAIGTYGFLTVNKKRGNYLRYVPTAVSTLAEDLVGDHRWPFLSVELPRIIASHQEKYAE